MSAGIHPTALIDSSADVGRGVTIGPYAILGPNVVVGNGCRLGPRVTLQRNVRLAEGVSVGDGSVLGGDPQDLKYAGEETWVEIGEGTIIREYSTINRGTTATFKTTVGARCFIMTYVHLAHDC
ncbi:MAG TPA: acyl-[acyl-carrier-protein]--UDP-N-acetylglucosamine O-acyltransferase, partial [Gemmatimonadales bacterium]